MWRSDSQWQNQGRIWQWEVCSPLSPPGSTWCQHRLEEPTEAIRQRARIYGVGEDYSPQIQSFQSRPCRPCRQSRPYRPCPCRPYLTCLTCLFEPIAFGPKQAFPWCNGWLQGSQKLRCTKRGIWSRRACWYSSSITQRRTYRHLEDDMMTFEEEILIIINTF